MQTIYGEMKPGFAGMIADVSNRSISSFAAEEGVNPGVPVVRGTDTQYQIKNVDTGSAANAFGIVVHEHKEPETPYFPVGHPVGVMTHGRIWVNVTGAVTAGKVANYDTDKKAFTQGEVSGNVVKLGIVCQFLTNTTGDGIAVVEIFGPAAATE